eukprot:TRINITY_DN4089_c0_g1_i3.p1 TRINITY_DN4089_c0_g1~~TRINITY_DN4089_c0_g1_i3.p1  ORF type:complete len:115 (+),score=41.20 TRINITY_DN4089_c0_g1_i3:63-407(+)
MNQKTVFLLFSLVLLGLLTQASAVAQKKLGAKEPAEVDEFALSAAEYAAKEKAMTLANGKASVLYLETQVVNGMNYVMKLALKDGAGKVANYDVIVNDKPWLQTKSLDKFELSK